MENRLSNWHTMKINSDEEWVLLFQHNERSTLQDALNMAIRDYTVTEIKVWTDEGLWLGFVRYKSYKGPMIHSELNDENQPS